MPTSDIARLERELLAARGNPQRHAEVRQNIREAGLPHLAAELDRIAATDPSREG
ncbi:hypothetical protein GA0074692_6849 [Micromonospora pallida]|uniref:Uncharacterized protein n=1 Tax=Micromonospora pallida TaxID=145854 RepID=A0A1C6TP85_9ACTN|nr:hypothetical protein [Micromonospora pallida]SCL42175.1 hypothetical protein GA0074692_6694 [Micromonospora pallida]SCL43373.1 hypothetical protein GA0074692_6849 [Micromonospora pallida]